MKLIIPARRGSKGVPFKNRILFDYTFNQIPKEFLKDVIVTTDDEQIASKCQDKDIQYIERASELSNDYASMKSVLIDLVNRKNLQGEDLILLYLTYPTRQWEDISSIYYFFKKNKFKSLLCQKEVKTHPYLCMYDLGTGRGKQIVKHNLYRRQDYPKMFEICHYVGVFKEPELKNLNDNLYNEDTYFYPIDEDGNDILDIDTISDLEKFRQYE